MFALLVWTLGANLRKLEYCFCFRRSRVAVGPPFRLTRAPIGNFAAMASHALLMTRRALAVPRHTTRKRRSRGSATCRFRRARPSGARPTRAECARARYTWIPFLTVRERRRLGVAYGCKSHAHLLTSRESKLQWGRRRRRRESSTGATGSPWSLVVFTPAMPEKKHYRARIAEALCAACGTEQPEDERTKCQACLQTEAERAAEERDRRRAAGLCPICGDHRPHKGFRSCGPCLERARDAYHQRGHLPAQGQRTLRT
jgi:hypothetical protein